MALAVIMGIIYGINEIMAFENVKEQKFGLTGQAAWDYYHVVMVAMFYVLFLLIHYLIYGKFTLRYAILSISYTLITLIFVDISYMTIMGYDISTARWESEIWSGVELGWTFGIPNWMLISLIVIYVTFRYGRRLPS